MLRFYFLHVENLLREQIHWRKELQASGSVKRKFADSDMQFIDGASLADALQATPGLF